MQNKGTEETDYFIFEETIYESFDENYKSTGTRSENL